MTRVLILMSNTGGGHRASALALQAAFHERYGEAVTVDIVDLWSEHTPWPLNRLPKSYRFLANDTPRLYKLVFDIGEKPEVITPVMEAITWWAERDISRAIAHYRPDLLVSVHPLLQNVPLNVLRRMRYEIPMATVVTDLGTFHPTWFDRGVALCFVPTAEGERQAMRHGLRPHQLRRYGLPIRPDFARPAPPKEAVRRELGLLPDALTALLVGGGEGMGPVKKIARAVADELATGGHTGVRASAQLVVVCGRNERLRETLLEQDWPIPTVIHGYIDNMRDWMAAGDCIITKAGPGTIAEALACGLPILLSGYLMGQEEGNVSHVLANRVGAYSDHPARIASIVGRWFGSERETLSQMAVRARALGNAQATYQIVDDLAALAQVACRGEARVAAL